LGKPGPEGSLTVEAKRGVEEISEKQTLAVVVGRYGSSRVDRLE
jgi:hypothetical protein